MKLIPGYRQEHNKLELMENEAGNSHKREFLPRFCLFVSVNHLVDT